MASTKTRSSSSPKNLTEIIAQIDSLCEEYLVQKAPFALPDSLKEFIVKIAPYFSVVLAILLLPVIFLALGLGTILAPFMLAGAAFDNPLKSVWGILHLLFSLAGIYLWIRAIPGLFKRSVQGWTFSFYNVLLNALQNLLSVNILGLLLGTLVNLYVLYQIKSKYKN